MEDRAVGAGVGLLLPQPRRTHNGCRPCTRISRFSDLDIQGLRAPSRVSSVSQLLTCRGAARPTLVVAAGPSDLVPLWEAHKFEATEFETIGEPMTLPEVQVRLVGGDRLQAEREFDFAFGGLSADDAVDRKLLSLAKSAWWAARQQLSADGAAHELKRFEQAIDTLSTIDPTKAEFVNTWHTTSAA